MLASAFLDALRATSAFFRMLDGGMIRLPLRTRIGAIASGASADLVAPGAAIPVSTMQLAAATLPDIKVAAIFAASRELLEQPGAEALLSRSLRASVSEAADQAFVDILALAASTSPSTGAPLGDLRAALSTIKVSDQGRLYWIAAPDIAIGLATLPPGRGHRPIVPRGDPDRRDAARPAVARHERRRHQRLARNRPPDPGRRHRHHGQRRPPQRRYLNAGGDPDGRCAHDGRHRRRISPTEPVPATAVSLWQTDTVAARCTLYMGAEVVRADSVAIIENIGW